MAKGQSVMIGIAAANHDPRAFPDPEGLDLLRRPGNKHLAVGFGLHFCLGASLLRREAPLTWSAVARRFPRAELAVDPSELE